MESRALQIEQDEVFHAAQEADASKVWLFQQIFTLKQGDFFSLPLPLFSYMQVID